MFEILLVIALLFALWLFLREPKSLRDSLAAMEAMEKQAVAKAEALKAKIDPKAGA